MGSQTPYLKFPYPVSSDLVADGAVNMQQIDEAVEDVMVVPSNALAPSAVWSSYPVGMSMMQVTNASDWPSSGVVLSIRRQGGDQTHQYWSGTSVNNPMVAFRYGSSGGWSKWIVLGSTGSPQEMAVETVTITTKANAYKTTKVTFPSGRFSTTPRVFTQYVGSTPHAIDVSPDSRSATAFNIITYANASWAAAIEWMAIKLTTDLTASLSQPPAALGGPRGICTNPVCENYQQPIPLGTMTWTDPDTGETQPIDEILCGACGQPITETVGGGS